MIKYHKLENLSDSDSESDNTAGILTPVDKKFYRNIREFKDELRLNSYEDKVAEISYKISTQTLTRLLGSEWMKFRIKVPLTPFEPYSIIPLESFSGIATTRPEVLYWIQSGVFVNDTLDGTIHPRNDKLVRCSLYSLLLRIEMQLDEIFE